MRKSYDVLVKFTEDGFYISQATGTDREHAGMIFDRFLSQKNPPVSVKILEVEVREVKRWDRQQA